MVDVFRLTEIASSIVGFVPQMILLYATLLDQRTRWSWHWHLRLWGLVVSLLGGVITSAAFLLRTDHHAESLSSWSMLFSAAWMFAWLWPIGYLGMILSDRSRARRALQEEGMAPSGQPARRLSSRSLWVSLAFILAITAVLEAAQFAYFDCTAVPFSLIVGFPVFMTVAAYPFGVYFACALPSSLPQRVGYVAALTVFAVLVVAGFGPIWLLSHMCP